jgi:arylsulfatase A
MRLAKYVVVTVLIASSCFNDLQQLSAVDAKSKNAPPNFVVFLTDDQGWGDLACYGHPKIQSPNLDKFASQGLRLTSAYAGCSVCSPSRSAVLTGRTPYRNGVWRWIPGGSRYHLRKSEITIATLLKQSGYATCHAGKWHLNGMFNSPQQPQPNDHGYDWWLATQNNASPNHMNPRNYVRNGKPTGQIQGPSAVIASDEASKWLRETKPKDKPFFITVWTHEPHLPIESAKKYMDMYKDIDDENLRQHHGNITQLDDAFGRLMKTLDELGYSENTLVIFTSDNGPAGNGTRGRTRGSTGGLRGRKRATHEGGIRVPGIIRWPAHFKRVGLKPGTVSDEPFIGSDIFPTICDVLKIDLPNDRVIDGSSILPMFQGKQIKRDQPLYWRNHLAPTHYRVAIRERDWKIVGNSDLTKFELYHIKEDIKETENVAAKYPDIFEALKKKLIEHDKAVLADGPDWWKSEQPKARKPGKSAGNNKPRELGGKQAAAPLVKGIDKTGDFDITKGATVTKHELGYQLHATGEGVALRKLETPITASATFSLQYQSTTSTSTKNACFVLGDSDENNKLIKVGSMIGMNTNGLFRGSWNNVRSGTTANAKFDENPINTVVTIDIKAGTINAQIGQTKIVSKLPTDLKRITHIGIYVKGTSSAFSKIEIK